MSGRCDPQARALDVVIGDDHPLQNAIEWRMQAFYSVDESIVEQRVLEQIEFPDSVDYQLNETQLEVTGSASKEWIASMSASATRIVGVDTLNTEQLIEIAPIVVEKSAQQIAQLIMEIEGTVLYFASGKTELEPASYQAIPALSRQLDDLALKSNERGLTVQLDAIGYSDPSGSKEANLRISRVRADSVLSALKSLDKNGVQMRSVSKGSEPDPLAKDDENDRHVRLKITLNTDDPSTINKPLGE